MLKILKNPGKSNFSDNEEALIKAIAKNDESAFQYLYQEYFNLVSGFIISKGGQEEDARDIFQEAVLGIWQNIKNGNYESKGQFKTYLLQICKFKWYDQLKSGAFKFTTELNEQVTANHPDKNSEYDQSEKLEELVRYYEKIEEPCKGLLKLFYFEKKSFSEIGKVLGVTPQSAKNQKYRCIQKIKELFKHQSYE